jgi:hypothetical protein
MAVGVIHVWMVYVLIGAQAPDEASLARIKSALQKPAPKLVITAPPPEADFRVNIDAIRPFADLFELPPWITPQDGPVAPRVAGNGRGAQLFSMDPGIVAHSLSNAVRSRRSHAEVIQAIVEYCRTHRDEPGAAGICGGPPR